MFCYVYKKKVDLEFLGQAGLVLCLRHIKGGFLVDFMDFEGCQENH